MFSGRSIAAIYCVCSLWTTNVVAADIAVQTKIDEVTVYRKTATITRTANVELPPGEHRLILSGLPDKLDPSALRFAVANSSVRLGGIELQRVIDTKFVTDTERTLRDRIERLQDQKAVFEDTVATAQTQLQLLEAMAQSPGAKSERPPVDGGSLTNVLATMGTGSANARAAIRDSRLKLRDIDNQIAATQEELAKVQTASKATTQVAATISVAAAVTAPVAIEYQVDDAGWDWSYEARLDTRTQKVSLFKQALVQQGSGETWSNVAMSVTTSRPTHDAATPAIASLYVDLQEPARNDELEEVVVTGMRGGRSSRRSRDTVTAEDIGRFSDAEVSATDFMADYRIPGRVTVAADRQTRVYPIAEVDIDVELVARAVMFVEHAARLEAKFTYAAEVPLDAGRVQIFRDGAFIGFASLPPVLPGSEVRMPFGVDEMIRIAVREQPSGSGRRGLMNDKRLEESRRIFEVTSFHASALPIEITDRIPVPRNSDIKVEALDGATQPTVRNLDDKPGVLLWSLPGTPRKVEKIQHYYSVRYPHDYQLSKSE
ncbi:MAG: mucoidy inhibitor MuiA family protein [Povalibacter sp.]